MLLLHKGKVSNYTVITAEYENESYLVVPVVMMVEGVHVGSQGAVYHSAESLTKPMHVAGWNGRPVVVNHPQINGNYVSANQTSIAKLGYIFDAFAEGNKLRANAYLRQTTLESYPELLAQINAGEVVEVSIGVFSDTVEEQGTWNGESYSGIAINHVPDHLAILPTDKGACSVADGCGIRINKSNENMNTIETFLIKLSVNELQVNEQSFQQIMESVRSKLFGTETSTTDYYLTDIFPTYFIYESNEKGSPLKFFKQMYSIDKTTMEVTFIEAPEQVNRLIKYQPITNNQKMERQTKPCCPEMITKIIQANSNGFTESDREVLNEMGAEIVGKIMVEDPNVISVNTSAKPSKEAIERILKAYSTKSEELVQFMPKEVQDAITQVNADKVESRRTSIETIQANTTQFAAEELESMNDSILTKMAASFTPADRTAQGFVAPQANQSSVTQEPIYVQ